MGAMGALGLDQNDVIFLGYPDCGLRSLYYNYTDPNSIYTSVAGFTQTYSYEGLGNTDYHSYIYGAPANYNKPSMILDIKTILRNYNPQDIYVTSGYDHHPDHYSLYFFVVESMTSLMKEVPSFQPTLHEGIVHEPCELLCNPNYHWPDPSFTPNQNFPEPPYLYTTPLGWNDVESMPLPTEMQDM